jgi:hypothetical protein
MFEIIMAIAAVVAMVRIASADGQSSSLWGLITFLLVVGSLFIPLPFIRVGIAFIVAFVAMFTYKVVANK